MKESIYNIAKHCNNRNGCIQCDYSSICESACDYVKDFVNNNMPSIGTLIPMLKYEISTDDETDDTWIKIEDDEPPIYEKVFVKTDKGDIGIASRSMIGSYVGENFGVSCKLNDKVVEWKKIN